MKVSGHPSQNAVRAPPSQEETSVFAAPLLCQGCANAVKRILGKLEGRWYDVAVGLPDLFLTLMSCWYVLKESLLIAAGCDVGQV